MFVRLQLDTVSDSMPELTSKGQWVFIVLIWLQDLLDKQMGMSLVGMQACCQADPCQRNGQPLPGARLPVKGFWLTKRPTAPSVVAAPATVAASGGGLMSTLPFKTTSSTSSRSSTTEL